MLQMKRYLLIGLVLFMSLFACLGSVSAQAIADGTYEVNYEMKESGNDNTSIADGYFSKPATLTVNGGVQTIQLTITGSDMVKELSTPNGPVTVVSEDEGNKTRTVKFQVSGDLSNPVPIDMHIVVPDLYDTTHTARAVFDVSGLATASSDSEESASSNEAGEQTGGKAEANPPTSDESPILLYASLLLGATGLLIIARKLRVN